MAVNWEILDIVSGDQALTSMFLFWGLMLLILVFRPTGLFGHTRIGKGKF